MSERTSYAPGTPSWVDLATPDIEGAARFYGEVFGWDVPERPNSAEMGGYRRAIKNGKDVAGMMPLMDGGQEGQPPAWTTYVSVADADATAAAVREAGGSVMAEPMDVMDLGRMAVFTDPEGAVEKVKAGGGEVLFGPMDIDPGRFATVRDPFGAFFNVMQPGEELKARMAEEGR